MAQTLGQLLINDVLPPAHRTSEQLSKSALNRKLVALAKEDPRGYVDVVTKLKKVGDEISTLEGISVGLDDIIPAYEARDRIVNPALEAVKSAKSDADREKVILEVQDKVMAHTKEHPGSMTAQALSGARGNIPQLMKIVATPVASVGIGGKITPWLFGKSYSEGLSPADYWVAGNESRLNTVTSSTSVAEPGDVAKILVNTLYPYTVTKDDCGTHNGIALAADDGHVLGRFLSKEQAGHRRNDLVTPAVAADLRKREVPNFYVRSPMTCEAHDGVCRKCQGLDERGGEHTIGVNVGVRAAQALSEPLTQMALSAKHGVRVLKGSAPKLTGLSGLRQLLEVPASFFHKATLAERAGTVTRVEEAPHGGHYVHVGDDQHYVGPTLKVTVSVGQKVEAGDRLCDGIPKPDELVKHKGLGVGREYLVNALHELYKDSGAGNVDKRHLEVLARADLNHVRVLEHSDHHPDVIKGDVITYGKLKELAGAVVEDVPLDKAEGHVLGREVLHFTAGTPVTESIVNTLKHHGVKSVTISMSAPRVEFLMRPITRNPLLNPDWMARLSHRYLKESLLKGAHAADVSNLQGSHPVPAYAFGVEFGTGPEGRY